MHHDQSAAETRTVIVTGAPGSGKSSVSRGLAARLPRAARVSADDVHAMIVSGGVWPLGHPRAEAARQVDLCHRQIGAVTTAFAADGFDTVIDCVLPDAAHLEQLLRRLPQATTSLVVLAPGEAVSRARNESRAREDRFDFDDHVALDASMREGFGGRGWWLDTAGLGLDTTIQLIADGVLDGELGRLSMESPRSIATARGSIDV